MAPSLALYFIDKAVQSWPSGYTYQIQSVTAFTGGVQLVLSRQGAKLPSEPGQYYFLTLTGISRLQKHPLSVTHFCAESSALTFFVRDMGPGTFSHKVCNTSVPELATARLTGPYGSLSLPRPLHKYHSVYLVAGGVGVTPMIGTAQFLLRVPPSARPTVHFVWVCRDQAAFFEWFPDMLLELLRCDDAELLLYHTARPVDPTGAPAGTAPMGLSALSPPPTSPSLTPEAEAERSLSGSPKDDSAITVS
eukprot:EG_transcript_23144